MLRINEAARRLGVTPSTLRRWEEEGLINPDRTAGGERRYHEGELDQLAARMAEGGNPRKGLLNQKRRVDVVSDEVPNVEDDSPALTPYLPPLPKRPEPWERKVHEARADLEVRKIHREKSELERAEREAEEARQQELQEVQRRAEEDNIRREARAREEQRLEALRDRGELVAAMSGAPTEYRAAVTRDLARYVSTEQFPPSLPSWQAYQYITARVEQVLTRWREQKAKEKESEQQRRHYESLLSAGRSHVAGKTSSWDSEEGMRARRDVERTLREEVEADWTREDVIDLVDEVLEEWED